MRFEKVQSPAQLVDGMDDLLKNLPLEAELMDPNKWRVIYKGIFNP